MVAKAKIEAEHAINKSMIVEAYHLCALENWGKIVELSKEATVVFNMIDVGDYFDAAVQSLCKVRGIPLIMGGTFSQSLTVDIFRPNVGGCYVCSADNLKSENLEKLLPSKIESITDLSFIERNSNPIGQSNCYLCVMCAMMMVSRYSTHLINDPEVAI